MFMLYYYWIPFVFVKERNLHIYLSRIQKHSHNIQEPTHEDTKYKWKARREKTTNFRLKVMWRQASTTYYIIFL